MSQENVEVVRKSLEAFNLGGIEALLRLTPPRTASGIRLPSGLRTPSTVAMTGLASWLPPLRTTLTTGVGRSTRYATRGLASWPSRR